MKKKDIEREQYKNCLVRIKVAENRLAALEYAISGLRDDNQWGGRSAEDTMILANYSYIRSALYKKINSEYQNLMFYITLSGNEELMNEVRLVAYEQFFAEKLQLNTKVTPDFFNPSGFFGSRDTSEEKEFLKNIKTKMIENRDSLDPKLKKVLEDSVLKEAMEELEK